MEIRLPAGRNNMTVVACDAAVSEIYDKHMTSLIIDR